jgi:hypothetical protein
MDLAFCPVFKNLKTFYLENCCLTGDLHALLRFLQLTPNLEKLTIELCEVYLPYVQIQEFIFYIL